MNGDMTLSFWIVRSSHSCCICVVITIIVILVFLNLMVDLFGGIAHYLCSVSIPLTAVSLYHIQQNFQSGKT